MKGDKQLLVTSGRLREAFDAFVASLRSINLGLARHLGRSLSDTRDVSSFHRCRRINTYGRYNLEKVLIADHGRIQELLKSSTLAMLRGRLNKVDLPTGCPSISCSMPLMVLEPLGRSVRRDDVSANSS